jgi:reactive intermediate/imine deaminase
MNLRIIDTPRAPQAIGTYSQAVRAGDAVYISGQLGIDPASGELVKGDVNAEIRRIFDNLQAIANAAGGSLANAVKLNVFVTDLSYSGTVNSIMSQYFSKPFPARVAVGVASLARGARVEIDCILAFA